MAAGEFTRRARRRPENERFRAFCRFNHFSQQAWYFNTSTFFLNVWKNRFRICMTQHPGWIRTGLAHPTFGWARRFFVLSTLYYCSQANPTKQDLKLSAAALNQNQARFVIQILLNQSLSSFILISGSKCISYLTHKSN